jgi:glycosyltransferase involved in cell wall biosynthesis
MESKYIPYNISEQILTVGPGDYKPYIGGMGYVLNVYYENFEVFKYLKVHEHKYHKAKWPLFKFFTKQYFKLIHILSTDKKIKVIHIHGAAYGSFYRKYFVFLAGKYLFGKKIIYHVHGSEFAKFYNESNSLSKRLVKNFVENADLLICLSNSWKDFFINSFKNIKRIEVLNNGINRPQITRQTIQARLDAPKITILFLGLIGDRKGVFDLLKAVVLHKEALKDKIEIIIGGNGEVDKLKSFILDNKLSDFVHFEGWISGDKKQELLKSSSVFILPTYNEGLPISILEAMSYNLPIISTPVGGIPEIVISGKNGILVDPGDVEGIYSAIKQFIDKPDLIESMGMASNAIVEPYYVENVFSELNKLYSFLLTKKAG